MALITKCTECGHISKVKEAGVTWNYGDCECELTTIDDVEMEYLNEKTE